MNSFAAVLCLFAVGVPAQPPHPQDDGANTWRLRGRAVDEHGKPIEGVSVALQGSGEFTTASALANPRAKSDVEGRFEVTVEEVSGSTSWPVPILAADGWSTVLLKGGMDHWGITLEREVDFGEVMLFPGVTLRGRVTTAGGVPLGGARVLARDRLAELVPWDGRFPGVGSYTSAAVTGKDGRFVLPGVTAGGSEITFTAEAHHRLALPWIHPGDPLHAELVPGGVVQGVAMDGDGRPCANAWVTVHHVASSDTSNARTGPDGKFEITLASPHAYRIEASEDGLERIGGPAHGVVLEGPARGVGLTVGGTVDPHRSVLVRISDAATGKAVADVRAAAIWAAPEQLWQPSYRRWAFDARARRVRALRELRLPGPSEEEPRTGIVIVEAAGYAPLVLERVVWTQSAPPILDAKLVRESVIAGVVTDARSGEPLEAAIVLLGDPDQTMPWFAVHDATARVPGGVFTDSAGRFRLGKLGAGKHRLRAVHPRRPRTEPIEIEVGPSETRDDVILSLPPGGTLAGKLRGLEPAAGWELRLRPPSSDHLRLSFEQEWAMPRSPIAADGSFALTGIEAGLHPIILRIPHRGGRCGWIEAEVDALRLDGEDLNRGFDASEVVPGTIRGTVTVAGAEVPRERLAVVARVGRRKVVDAVAADGSFALPCFPGDLVVSVIDMATRVPLAVSPAVRVAPGETCELTLHVEAVRVHVRLRPDAEGGDVVASHVEAVVQHDYGRPQVRSTSDGFDTDTGVGVTLAGRAAELDLLLPLVPTRLIVRSNHTRVHEGRGRNVPLGEARITPERGGDNRVEIGVRAPRKPERK